MAEPSRALRCFKFVGFGRTKETVIFLHIFALAVAAKVALPIKVVLDAWLKFASLSASKQSLFPSAN